MSATQRFLILDDDQMTGSTIRNIAEFAGVSVEFTDNPRQFFELVESWNPHFIALDLVMPGMDGMQVIAELGRRSCAAQIIVISGVGSRVLDAAGRSVTEHGLNFRGVLPKPFSPTQLRELLLSNSGGTVAFPMFANQRAGNPEVGPADLQRAIKEREITLAYQPKVDCHTGRLVGVEALARWTHPSLGVISPDQFIAVAEQHQLIDPLTEQLAEQAINWLAGLSLPVVSPLQPHQIEHLLANLSLSINISARSLNNLALFDRIETVCDIHGIRPNRLILELTETSAMDNPTLSLDTLTRLRMKGFHLSLDDFGTGYSSMLQLVRLPFSEIKVDRSFVIAAARSEESKAVIRSIVELGRSLQLQTTAEGIEDDELMAYLQSIGCELVQGYYIARPMPADELCEWILRWEAGREERRLRSLRALHLLDTSVEDRFDRLTQLACSLFSTPMASFTLVDENRQWFKSSVGLSDPETPREISFCSRAIDGEGIFIVNHASQDPRFASNPAVTGELGIQFYAGAVLRSPDREKVGTLCVMDTQPRSLETAELRLLHDLAQLVEKEIFGDWGLSLDAITGLLNRDGFESRAQNMLGLTQHRRMQSCLLIFQLDNLDVVLDEGDYHAGGQALRSFTGLLRDGWRDAHLLGRTGRDEFSVLLLGCGVSDVTPQLQSFSEQVVSSTELRGYPLIFRVGAAETTPGEKPELGRLVEQACRRLNRLQQSPVRWRADGTSNT